MTPTLSCWRPSLHSIPRLPLPLVLLLSALLAAACSDAPLAPPEAPDLHRSSGPLLSAQAEVFTCYTSRLTPQGPHRYRYRTLRLHFPREIVDEAGGEVLYFQYVLSTPEGKTIRLANCIIPRSPAALEIARQRFTTRRGDAGRQVGTLRFGDSTGTLSTSEDDGNCVDENSEENPCRLKEVGNLCAEYPDDPECQADDEDPWEDDDPCMGDPTAPGCGGGGDDDCGDCWGGGGGGGCGDERDTIIAEYRTFGVAWTPSCSDFKTGGGSAHFSWSELNGGFRTGNPHAPWGHIKSRLTQGLEATRSHYNRGAIRISSGYRCPHGNSHVRGASSSFHVHGRAADMYSLDHPWTEEEFNRLRDAAWATGPVELLHWHSYADRHLHAAW